MSIFYFLFSIYQISTPVLAFARKHGGNSQLSITMATFTAPEEIGTNPCLLLWLLPLAASITIAYKATKVPTITAASFIKEAATLFGSILVFMIIIAVILLALAWLIIE